MIKAILIDIDDTLLSFDEYVKQAMKSGFAKFSIGTYTDDMYDVFTSVNTRLWRSIEEGTLTLERLKQIRWNLIFEKLGISADGIAFEKYFRDGLFQSAILEDGATELVRYLHSRYILCAASNGPYLQQKNRLERGGMLEFFSHLFISEKLGYSKPSEKFFKACLKELGNISPCEVMVIGDSLSSDIAGGICAGMHTCLYNPKARAVPAQLKIDHIVSSLKEITKIL